ncbi:hypothetical protein D3C80_1913070 [compost metagenome]
MPGEQLLPQKRTPCQLKLPFTAWLPVSKVFETQAETLFTSSDPLEAPVRSLTCPQKLKASSQVSPTFEPLQGDVIHHSAPRLSPELIDLHDQDVMLLLTEPE